VPSNSRSRHAGTPTRVTKAERKEQARLQRVELQRKMARARRNRTIGIAGVVVVGVAVVGVLALTSSGGKNGTTSPTPTASLPGEQTGTAPWTNGLDTLQQRLPFLHLPTIANPLALHWHAHLDVFVNGNRVTVPAEIGFGGTIATSLHTHDDTGVIHMETNDPNGTFTLGEFFDVWGVRLTPGCVGGYCSNGTDTIRMFVNGTAYHGDPRTLTLKDHMEIVLMYGTQSQVPKPLPTFDWSKLVA
jgi:hypothetical protein